MKKTLKAKAMLHTPTGKVLAPIRIVYEDNEDIKDPKSEFCLSYGGIEYMGMGKDSLWTDTFADLQLKLPENIKIACCMTCRYGNMCPYGNIENQLFCTKDIKITDKGDLCDLFDRTDPFEERAVASVGYCDDFVYQSTDYFTYNDYLYQLEKKVGRR